MTPEVQKELQREQLSDSLRELTKTCMSYMKCARSAMADRYETWDRQHEIYRQQRVADKEDRRAYEQGKPVKMIVPLTFAQINTLVSFFKMLYTQNSRFYELSPVSMMDSAIREVAELLVQRDLDQANWSIVLDQFLLDVCKYGLGILQTSWVKETTEVYEDVQQVSAAGAPFSAKQVVEVVTFEGNKVFNVSPYKFFPDHRWPTRDFQLGEYCGVVEEHTRTALERMEKQGQVAGLEHTKNLESRSENNLDKMRISIDLKSQSSREKNCVISIIQMRLVPSEIFLSDDTPLGPEKQPVLFTLWLANDDRIIKLERVNAAHNRFTFEAGELFPDIHEKNNSGLAELINDLQELVGWFVNSRVSAVSKTIDNWLVADPRGVDMNTIESRARVIMLKQGATQGVDKYIKQLAVQDTTTRHMDDASTLIQLMQTVTGVNENAMGQYNGGRRSATEARAVIQGASGRMRNLAVLLWQGVLAPLGRQLVLNQRQGLSQEQFIKVVGEERAELYPAFNQPISKLLGSYDLFVFDSTSPSEKSFLAQSLQELLTIVLTNPVAAAQFNLDPAKMIKEIYELRGIPGLPRFAFDPVERQGLLAAAAQGADPASGSPGAAGSEPAQQGATAGSGG
jgi:hypothetical protein